MWGIVLKFGLKYWRKIAVIAAVVAAVLWLHHGYQRHKELEALEQEYLVYKKNMEILMQDMHADALIQEHHIKDLQRDLTDATLDRDILRSNLLEARIANNELTEDLIMVERELQAEDLGETCEEQVNWVIENAEKIGKW